MSGATAEDHFAHPWEEGDEWIEHGDDFKCPRCGILNTDLPDERVPMPGETSAKMRDPFGAGMLYCLGLTAKEARRLRMLLEAHRPAGTIGRGWTERPLQRLDEVLLPQIEADEARR